jgi:hypothetical protein
MSRRVNFAKTYQVEWELPQNDISIEEWNDLIILSEDEKDDYEDEIWSTEYDDCYEVPKSFLEKRIKQYENSNKKLFNFCMELLEKADKDNDFVRVEIF